VPCSVSSRPLCRVGGVEQGRPHLGPLVESQYLIGCQGRGRVAVPERLAEPAGGLGAFGHLAQVETGMDNVPLQPLSVGNLPSGMASRWCSQVRRSCSGAVSLLDLRIPQP
jgi:hypothetical protein